MDQNLGLERIYRVLGGLSGIAGVVLLVISFLINTGPPPGVTPDELVKWGKDHFVSGLWGAWLQAVGPVLIVLFAFVLVHLSDASHSLAGWMTFFGATVLTTVSLIEITFYISAWFPDLVLMPSISLRLIAAVQHLYFIVAAPALFLPLGVVLLRSPILPRIFAHLAIVLGIAFVILGAVFLLALTLPTAVTASAGVQAIWWLAAAITLLVRANPVPNRLP
jgi:hypothetical protein